jgi:hypothetical protein
MTIARKSSRLTRPAALTVRPALPLTDLQASFMIPPLQPLIDIRFQLGFYSPYDQRR